MASIPFENVPRISPLDPISSASTRSDGEATLPFDQILQRAKTSPRPDIENESKQVPSSYDNAANNEDSTAPATEATNRDDSNVDQAEGQDNDEADQSSETNDGQSKNDDNEQSDGQDSDDDAAATTVAAEQAQAAKAELELTVNANLETTVGAEDEEVATMATVEDDSPTDTHHEIFADQVAVAADPTAELADNDQGDQSDQGEEQGAKVKVDGELDLDTEDDRGQKFAGNDEDRQDAGQNVQKNANQDAALEQLEVVEEASVAPVANETGTGVEGERNGSANRNAENSNANTVAEKSLAVETIVDTESSDTGWHGGNRRNQGGKDEANEALKAANPAGSNGASVPNTKGLSEHLMGQAQEARGGQSTLNEVDQSRFLQRVARAFQTAQERDGAIRLRLHPPELGSMRLEVKMQGGVMTARIETETNMARSVLMESLPVLRERLAEQGIRVENFDIDLMDRSLAGEMPEDNNQNQTDESDTQANTQQADGSEGDDASETEAAAGLDPNGLNVVI